MQSRNSGPLAVAHLPTCLLVVSLLSALDALEPSADAEEGRRETERLRVAVIGGGVAGSATALELLNHDVKVTIFEQADRIGHNKSASGIIAALTIFDPQDEYFHSPDSPGKIFDFIQQQSSVWRTKERSFRMLQFAHRMWLNAISGDMRAKKAYRQNFTRAARLRLETQLDRFPEMCGAIHGPYCCRKGSQAREWLERTRGESHNRSCDVKDGVFHTWVTQKGWAIAADDPEAAARHGWRFAVQSNDSAHYWRSVEEYLRQSDVQGVLWDSVDEGFVQVESLYPILTDIFQRSGKVRLALRCLVSSLKESSSGIEVVAPGCPDAGVYDRVIVAGGANSVNVLADQDALIQSDLLPIKGFAVATHKPLIDKAQLGVGMLVEDLAHYIRPTVEGGVAYGFGKESGTWDDQLLAPEFNDWPILGPSATGLGRAVLNQTDVARLAGIRPLSAWNAFPLLKRYDGPWKGLVLNTGYGFYGYTLGWKSAQLAAEVAVTGKVSDPEFAASIELYTGCGTMPCWAWHLYLIVGCLFGTLVWCFFLIACACCCFFGFKKSGRSRNRVIALSGEDEPLKQCL